MARDDRTGPGRSGHGKLIADVLRALATGQAPGDATDEGLRERKKRLTRQLISDTATMMFLDRGFDDVKVAEVAAACDVSEKTVYNYFPTKESLVFDRTDELAAAIGRSLRDSGDGRTIVESVTASIGDHIEHMLQWWTDGDALDAARTTRRFADMVEATPALRAARQEMFEVLTQAAADALADRAGVRATDPEPQLAALLVVGLWRVALRSLHEHAAAVVDRRSVADARSRVTADVQRAARMADAGLSSFDAAVRLDQGRQSVKDAADAVAEARRQVVLAIRQAHTAWKQVKDLGGADAPAGAKARTKADVQREVQRLKQEAKREAMQAHMDAQRARQAARQRRER